MNSIKHYRDLVGLTQQQLGRVVKVGQGAIGHYEAGRRDPDLNTCRQIAAALAEAGAVNSAGIAVTLDDVFPAEPQTQTPDSNAA